MSVKSETVNKTVRLFGLYDTPEQKHSRGEVFDVSGLSPTLNTCGGGYGMPLIVVEEKEITNGKCKSPNTL